MVAQAYSALERLDAAGLRPVVVTGRPAGWCDHIARRLPLAGVIGENGACWFHYDCAQRRMQRRLWKDEAERQADRKRRT